MNLGPFVLEPAVKDYIWGGTRLKTEYGKKTDLDVVAESWECSIHPDGYSRIATGPWKGRTLAEFLEAHPEAMGIHGQRYKNLPVLVKLIDAKEDLSVQVHPNSAYALEHEGQSGKTELWYILKADPGATLIYGFAHDVTPELVRRSAQNGTILEHLQRVPVCEGDVFFIEPGTVHAIGGGILLAEIQENSNVTYRIYDYSRRDKEGKLRELHLEKALEVMDFKAAKVPRSPQRMIRYTPGMARELVGRCQSFQVERIAINGECSLRSSADSLQIYVVIEGESRIGRADCAHTIKAGETILIAANRGEGKIYGRASLIRVDI
ncbi:MAG: class I mannose-6-phosphate isomerase [Clostridiales bacterium]|nr:class I mannose-6-phosphate isomerase [Clostridiales bacterium]